MAAIFLGFSDLTGVYATTYYTNQPSLQTVLAIAIVNSRPITNANVALGRAGSISGRVQNACYGDSPPFSPLLTATKVSVTAGVETKGIDMVFGSAGPGRIYLPQITR